MAFFDKLKEKVNKVVDVDKLGEMANKTITSVKHEVAKVVDPSVKEQERLEKEKALREQEEQKKQEKEREINDFLSSIDVDKELNYIFTILEKSGVSASNFEKGVEHLLSKTETTITKGEVLPYLKKELFARAFSAAPCVAAQVVATDYFMRDIVSDGLLSLYMRFAISREKGSYTFMEEPFIKALYGVAGHAVNYQCNQSVQGNYQVMTPSDFITVIENSDVLKSYTDNDPFAADEVRMKWANDLCNAPIELVKSSKLSELLGEEEYVDALYYYAYVTLDKDQEEQGERAGIAKIASVYMDYLKEYYNRIR